MSIDQEVRPRYSEGQYLGADDLTAGVVWALGRDERHLLGAHTWGIATGVQLQEVPSLSGNGVDVFIRPGYAWDGFGRPIVVLAPYQIPADLFQAFTSTSSANPSQSIAVWLQYDEVETQPAQPGFAPCSSEDTTSRVVETFRLVVGPFNTNASRRDPISVAGRSIDASLAFQNFVPTDGILRDGSVPFQSLPDEGATAKWLIPLGFVQWQPNATVGQPGNFVASSDANKAASRAARTYVGVVAESLLAADGVLCLADRTCDYRQAAFQDLDLVRVQGALRAEGAVRFWGTPIDFRNPTGDDEGTPLLMVRNEDASAGVKMLDVQIGTKADGNTRFGVGPLNAAGTAIEEKFAVLDSGNVGIGTTTPITALQIPERGIQIGVNGTASVNFHVVSDTNDPNQTQGLRFYNGNYGSGKHLLTVLPDGQVGIGLTATNPQLQLDIQGNFGRTNGPATVHLWGSTVADLGTGTLFLRSGGTIVAADQPGVRFGIGTSTPGVTLDVQGDLNVSGNASKPGGGSWSGPSDAALKKNIRPLTAALDQLLRLRGVHFEWKDPARMGGLSGTQTGLIAQEVEAVFPEWIGTAPDGHKEMTIRGFEALAVEAFRDLQNQIRALQARVVELEEQSNQARHTPATA
jgi:Chaperone of endosialidase